MRRRTVLALGAALLGGACVRRRLPAYLAFDRGASERLTLDAQLCRLARVPWRPDGAQLVRRAALDAHAWLALERGRAGEVLLWRGAPGGGRTLLGSFPGACAVAAQRDELLVGGTAGTLVRLAPDGALRGVSQRGGPVRSLAPGPGGRTWWCLSGEHEAELSLLAGDLGVLWSVRTGLATDALAPEPGRERAWLAAGARVRAFGPGGVLAQELELPGGPWTAALAARDELVLFAAGAVLRCEARGGRMRPACAQGGFRALVALVAAAG